MTRLFAFAPAIAVLLACGCSRPAGLEEQAAEVAKPKPDEGRVAPMPRAVGESRPAKRPPVAPMPHPAPETDLTNEDVGLGANIEAALPEIERVDQPPPELPGIADPVGLPDLIPAGIDAGTPGNFGAMQPPADAGPFSGRSGATKEKLLKEGGGNAASEQAVARGLAWLAKQQKADGSWEYDAGKTKEKAAATGMALLPFLAAGHTHKPEKAQGKNAKEQDYAKVVKAGLVYLVKNCPLAGANPGRLSENMYAQAIGTLALCEAYGMTKDPALKPYAQAAVNYIQKAQGKNGSWGYTFQTSGDTSIVGWQIQALHTAKLSKLLVLNDRVIKNAVTFLDSVSAGSKKEVYGYAQPDGRPGTALTAVGLLCRHYADGWGPAHPGLVKGVAGLMKNPPEGKGGVKDLYYLYYATQVLHSHGGEDWVKWNEGEKQADGTRKNGVRDWLVEVQVKEGANQGSWEPETGYLGKECGRLGTTAMTVLTLEVYYRYLPLYKRDEDAKLPDGK